MHFYTSFLVLFPTLIHSQTQVQFGLLRDKLWLQYGLPPTLEIGDAAYALLLQTKLQNGKTKKLTVSSNFTDRAWYEARGFFSTRTQYLFSCVNIEPEKAKKKKKNKISATKEEPKKEEAQKEESRKSIDAAKTLLATGGQSCNLTGQSCSLTPTPKRRATNFAIAVAVTNTIENPIWVERIMDAKGSPNKVALFNSPNCAAFPGTTKLHSYDWCVTTGGDGILNLDCSRDAIKSIENRGFVLPADIQPGEAYPTRSVGVFGSVTAAKTWPETHQKEIAWTVAIVEIVTVVLCAVACAGCCSIGVIVGAVVTGVATTINKFKGSTANSTTPAAPPADAMTRR